MLSYRSGEAIRKGDRVLFHGNAAEIKVVADPRSDDAESEWYVKEFGGGVLIDDPSISGSTFICKDSLLDFEDLEFIARAERRSDSGLATQD